MTLFQKWLLLPALLLILGGCATNTRIVQQWPQDMPSLAYFESAYWADEDNQQAQTLENYLTWIKRFYQGWTLYDNGWNKMSSDLVGRTKNPHEKSLVAEKIKELGIRISAEWAKEKDSRFVRTKTVSTWGESLLESLSRGQTIALMDRVSADIGLLETGELALDQVQIERYFPDLAVKEDDDFFF